MTVCPSALKLVLVICVKLDVVGLLTSAYLAVSAATADDLSQLLAPPVDSIAWCHLAPAPIR